MLPTEKTKIKSDFKNMKVAIIGQPKTGKTTFASQLGEDAIFAATEPGHDFLEIFKTDIKQWSDFSTLVTELCTKEHKFKTLVIDITDNLVQMAEVEICKRNKVEFIKDIGFGAGYTATKRLLMNEFMKVVEKGLGIIFVCHPKEKELIQDQMKWTVMATSLGNSYEKEILGLCDLILYAYINQQGQRKLRTKPNKYVQCAGDRSGKLPEIMDLDAKSVINLLNPKSEVKSEVKQETKIEVKTEIKK